MSAAEDEVREVMGAVLQIHPGRIDATASSDTIETWDSLQHLNLILALEERFGVQFTLEEAETMTSYEAIMAALSHHMKSAV